MDVSERDGSSYISSLTDIQTVARVAMVDFATRDGDGGAYGSRANIAHGRTQHLGNHNEHKVWFPDPTTGGRESRCSRGRSATSTPALVFAISWR